MTARHAPLGAILALPLALLALALPSGERAGALAAALPALAGVVLLDLELRRRVPDGTAFWALVLAVYGTGLYPLLAHAPDARRATAFLAGALAVLALRAGATMRARMVGFALALLVGLALGPWRLDAPGMASGLFGSRNGLLFRTPLLWACLAGLAVLLRREGRAAAPLAATGALPFVLAPLVPGAAVEVALPALLTGLAVGLDALCRLLARRPAWALAPVVPLLALSNLLFMQQYRDTLRRDDTVSFPQVSEGNARLLANAVGSPIAWPANWRWSARHDLPVERWDLLSGQRLDPRRGVTIDVGDLEQDAAFLLDGWSVRHACGAAICREVEGRAEMVIPLEYPPAQMWVRAAGPGALRIRLNGADLGAVAVGPSLSAVNVPIPGPWRALNRVELRTDETAHVLVDGVTLMRGER